MNNNEFGIEQQTINKLLSVGKEGVDALTLYVYYRYIATTLNVRAIKDKPKKYRKQLKWGEIKFKRANKILKELDLIKKFSHRNDEGKIVSWYIIIH